MPDHVVPLTVDPVPVDTAVHAHPTACAGWDCETRYSGTVYVLFCCADFARVKIGFTRNRQPGVERRLTDVRRERDLPGLTTLGTVDLGECTEVDGWAREEAIRLWLVHRHGFRWSPWQDWLEVPDRLDADGVVRLVIAARDALHAWLSIDEQAGAPGVPRTELPD